MQHFLEEHFLSCPSVDFARKATTFYVACLLACLLAWMPVRTFVRSEQQKPMCTYVGTNVYAARARQLAKSALIGRIVRT